MSNNKKSLGLRTKLIIIFIFIKVLPLLVLAWFAWSQVSVLVQKIYVSYENATLESQEMGKQIIQLASKDSIRALDEKSQESIERLASDTARTWHGFYMNETMISNKHLQLNHQRWNTVPFSPQGLVQL